MMKKLSTPDIYIVHTEVEVLSTSDTYEGTGRMVCFVACFCSAENKQDAVGKAKFALLREAIQLLKVESITLYEENTWEGKDQEEVNDCVNQALKTGEVIYSRFSCYYE